MAKTAAYGDKDLSAASDVWGACFGKEGNFTVIVEESLGDASDDVEVEDKRTEFKVWSVLLTQWSPVFEKMIGSDNYTESQKANVVIQDFSATAVGLFLRFLYSGSVDGTAGALVEVAAMADKYQVKALYTLCVRIVRKALNKPELACEVFASANQFQLDGLRMDALEQILTQPAEALKKRPALRPELLEEILDSGLLCMSDDDLKRTLQSWGKKGTDSLQPIIDARIQRATVRKPGVHTQNVLRTLWDRYVNAGKGAFLGYWVVVILGPQQAEMCREDATTMANGQCAHNYRKGWVQWLLPHSSVHLQGFAFSHVIAASTSFRIWSSEDGATWHLAYESHKKEIKGGTFLPCKRAPSLVKWFKLEVLEGELSSVSFNIHGILQTSV